jgi:maltose O-acetyltransferase
MIRNIIKLFCLILYYTIFKNLPSRNVPSSPIVIVRGFLCRFVFRKTGVKINIQKNVYFGKGNNISIGNYSGIGEGSILGQDEEIRIGNNVLIGPHLMIFTQNHNFGDRTKLIREQGATRKPVIIEDDVWIGARVILLPGVTMGRGSVVAAGAVVTKSFPPFSIIGGVPARIIGNR